MKRSNKVVAILSWYDCLHGKSQELYKNTPETKKWIHYSCRIQDQYTKINWIYIYWQWTSGNWYKKNVMPFTVVPKNMKNNANKTYAILNAIKWQNADEKKSLRRPKYLERYIVYESEDSQ